MEKITSESGLQDLKNAFFENREGTMHEVYRLHRDAFMNYCQAWSENKEDNLDCFQEAVIALYENLVKGKIKTDTSSLRTYLFAIGKHKVLDELEKRKKRDKKIEFQSESISEYSNDDEEIQYLILNNTMGQLGTTCKELLVKFYYQQYSIEAIKIEMNYKNQNTVKAHKSRCMKKLKELMSKTSE